MTKSQDNGKLNALLNLQTFGILLVVLGHSIPRGNIDKYPEMLIRLHEFIYSFHMPLFMMLSGFLFMYSTRNREIRYGDFIGKKAVRLLIPYLTLTTLAYPKVFFAEYAENLIEPGITTYIRGIVFPAENPMQAMWFLPVLFTIFLAAPFLKKLLDRNNLLLTLSVFAALSSFYIFNPLQTNVLGITYTINFIVYFYLGAAIAKLFENSIWKCGRIHYVILSLTALVLINFFFPGLEAKWLALPAAVIGILFSFTLVYMFDRRGWKFFGWIDGYSYQIYLLSWFVQMLVRVLYQKNIYNEYICFALMLSLGVIVPVLITKLVEKKLSFLRVFIGLR